MRSRFFVTATIMAAVIVMLAAFGHTPAEGASTPSTKDPIVIVYICDLKSQGVPVTWMEVAVKQINESGGILGREVKFIYGHLCIFLVVENLFRFCDFQKSH